MQKKVIGVVSYDADDFKSFVDFIVAYDYLIVKHSKRRMETNDTIYICASKSIDVCGMSFDTILFTQKAIFNKEIERIVHVIRPYMISPKEKTV